MYLGCQGNKKCGYDFYFDTFTYYDIYAIKSGILHRGQPKSQISASNYVRIVLFEQIR
jgi:hypothetical protein